MVSIRDLITEDNVARTYQERKYVCFVLKNGMIVKLDPNQANINWGGGKEKQEGQK